MLLYVLVLLQIKREPFFFQSFDVLTIGNKLFFQPLIDIPHRCFGVNWLQMCFYLDFNFL